MISDLLKPERQNLVIREDRKRGVFVEGLSEWVVRSPAEVYGLMERGAAQRATGATKLNEMSSRSHAVFIIIVEKSTVMAEDTLAAEDEEMEQFRGLAPGETAGMLVAPLVNPPPLPQFSFTNPVIKQMGVGLLRIWGLCHCMPSHLPLPPLPLTLSCGPMAIPSYCDSIVKGDQPVSRSVKWQLQVSLMHQAAQYLLTALSKQCVGM